MKYCCRGPISRETNGSRAIRHVDRADDRFISMAL